MKEEKCGTIGSQQTVFLDLEAKRGPDEVGGWNNIWKMGLGVAVTLEIPEGRWRIFEEGDVPELVKLLNQCGERKPYRPTGKLILSSLHSSS